MRNATLVIFLLVVIIVVGGFIYYKNNYLPKYRWSHNYQRNNDQPYGLSLFNKLVKQKAGQVIAMQGLDYQKLDTATAGSNLLFVQEQFSADSSDAAMILQYAAKGNRVLIATDYSPVEILRTFVPVGDSIVGFSYRADSMVTVSFTQENLPYKGKLNFHHRFLKDTTTAEWSYYRKSYMLDTLSAWDFEPISILDDSCVNAFYLNVGKGRIVIHCNPLLFTNFYLSTNEGFLHCNNFLSFLQHGPVYWMEPWNGYPDSSAEREVNNPLRFLFSHPHLKWGWYVFLIAVLLYLFFRSKRRQRIIPLMPVNVNTSIEYTKAIGSLYFQKRSHRQIASEMHLIFLAEIRSRYNIPTDVPDEELAAQLHLRSGLSTQALNNLLKQFRQIHKNDSVTESELIRLHDAVDYYHKKRK